MPAFLVMIQFAGQFPRQTEAAEKAGRGPSSDDMILGVDHLSFMRPASLQQDTIPQTIGNSYHNY